MITKHKSMGQLLNNPFTVISYMGSDYFCDREKETATLLKQLTNGNSITLTAIRRIGKTGLIHHLFGQLPVGVQGVYLDILDTENMAQFLNKLASALMGQFPEKNSFGKQVWNFLKTLRPTLNFDPLTGSPQASFSLVQGETETNIYSIFRFLEGQSFKVVIAIDEFQQILQYPEKNVDAWLRSYIQQLKNVQFIFSGSQQHLMNELFASPDRPFYRSTQFMKLEKIPLENYTLFIEKKFTQYKKQINETFNNL